MDGGLGRATCWHTWLLHRAWLQRWQRLQGSSQGLGGYAQSCRRCLAQVLLLLLAISFRINERHRHWQTNFNFWITVSNIRVLQSFPPSPIYRLVRIFQAWHFSDLSCLCKQICRKLIKFSSLSPPQCPLPRHTPQCCIPLSWSLHISEQFANSNSMEHCAKVF